MKVTAKACIAIEDLLKYIMHKMFKCNVKRDDFGTNRNEKLQWIAE
jgi:hypothetical protein